MTKFISLLERILAVFCVVLCIALVISVVWQVFSRYVLNAPSTVTDELARFLFIWVGLVGAAYGLGKKKHLAIDLLLMKLEASPKKYAFLQLIINLISIFFITVIMCYGGMKLVLDTIAAGQISPVLGIQMGLVYLALPVSGFFMLIFSARDLFAELRQLSAQN
ncbi:MULTISPECIES: TRAP transporter small permease [Basfia]|uniref:TRAP transporter small permease protein n=2 Tax=Basfia TaxID=697331 RepID=Q65V62_MANSM|nr:MULTISPECIES: TRAP transporter small permease [Basfia]AAU37148.1 unknown [[Mannheimia] succiniciproducens MBEL55E]QIM67996.1 C4-dicarboxylate ABC transporter permease [Basfia succiniciproducens]SCX85769.1 TRAP-type C4-dicarboxylate transport system, small permease component [Basfia succiniciproducens]SEP63250.1 TRAP-type C4-dicarboxylate transport system, small permease component [Basfia succiniciproducens]